MMITSMISAMQLHTVREFATEKTKTKNDSNFDEVLNICLQLSDRRILNIFLIKKTHMFESRKNYVITKKNNLIDDLLYSL